MGEGEKEKAAAELGRLVTYGRMLDNMGRRVATDEPQYQEPRDT
jgi:hypothetical protein